MNEFKIPRLETTILSCVKNIQKNINTCFPGEILSFNIENQTAVVRPLFMRKIDGQAVAINDLHDVPVRFFKTNRCSISLPIEVGDYVMLLFSQRSLDIWLTKGGQVDPDDPRMHNMNDAIALPLLYDQEKVINNYNNNGIEIKTDTAKIEILKNGNINIISDGSLTVQSLNTIIKNDVKIEGNLIVEKNVDIKEEMTVAKDIIANDIILSNINISEHIHIDAEERPTGVPI